MTTLQQLQESFKTTELHAHCEDIDNAMQYYNGDNDADDFIQWYTETYIHSAEIIYYHNAMKFLLDYDPSLIDSLTLASEMGCNMANLNSETLAGLLLKGVLSEALESLRDEIEEYFEALESEAA